MHLTQPASKLRGNETCRADVESLPLDRGEGRPSPTVWRNPQPSSGTLRRFLEHRWVKLDVDLIGKAL